MALSAEPPFSLNSRRNLFESDKHFDPALYKVVMYASNSNKCILHFQGVFLAFAIVVNFCNAKIYKCQGNHEETVVFNGLDTLTWKSTGTNKE